MNRLVYAVLVAMMAALSVEGLKTMEEMKQEITSFVKECQAETKATDDDIKEWHEKMMPTSPAGKCMLACLYKKGGVIKDNKYSAEGMLQSAKQAIAEGDPMLDKIKKMSTECDPKYEGNDVCELGVKIMECFKKNFKPMAA